MAGLIESRGGVVIAAALGLLWETGLFDRLNGRWFGEEALEGGGGREWLREVWTGGLTVERLLLALGVVVGLLVGVRLISMVWTLIRLHGFQVRLAGEDLSTEFGFFTRVAATIPRHRIQTLTVREGPLHRLFGRVSVKVETAGAAASGGDPSEGESRQREWLAPILRRAELPAFTRALLPELDLDAVAWQGVAPGAFRREVKGGIFVAVLATLPFVYWLGAGSLAVLAVFTAWAVVAARLTIRHLGWATTEREVLFKSGWAWRQVTVARFAKIQAVSLHESPFDRRRAMARVIVDTAGAGELSHRVDVPYLAKETAVGLTNQLAAEAGRTAFRW